MNEILYNVQVEPTEVSSSVVCLLKILTVYKLELSPFVQSVGVLKRKFACIGYLIPSE